jgi:FMN phosphatase YigB (HAD superfamily)
MKSPAADEPNGKRRAFLFDFMGVVGYSRMAVSGDPGNGSTRVLMYGEVVEALRSLHNAGFRLALVSNNDRRHFGDVAPDVARSLEELFDVVVYSSDVDAEKPSPLIYQAALSALDVCAQDAHYFDDLARNVDAAIALGMTGTVVTSPADVLEIVAEALAG